MKSKLRWNYKQILGRPDGNNHSTPIQRELYQREHDLPESLPHVIVGITQQQPESGHLERVSSLARSITITDTQRISSFFSLTMFGQISSPSGATPTLTDSRSSSNTITLEQRLVVFIVNPTLLKFSYKFGIRCYHHPLTNTAPLYTWKCLLDEHAF